MVSYLNLILLFLLEFSYGFINANRSFKSILSHLTDTPPASQEKKLVWSWF